MEEANEGFTVVSFTLVKACAKQFTDRDSAIYLCQRIMAEKKLSIKKAKAEKIGLGREVVYADY